MKTILKSCTQGVFLAGVFSFSALAQAQWTATATEGISLGSLISATDAGAAPAGQALTVRVGMKMRNQAALESYVKAINDPSNTLYGQSLTPAEFAASYGAASSDVQAVTGYLASMGFTNIVVEPNNLLISADGNVAAEAAFNTKIENFTQFGKSVFGNVSAAEVPSSLGGAVGAVLGLNTIGQMKPMLALKSTAKPSPAIAFPTVPQYLVSYTPPQFQKIYDTWGTPTASKTSIAIMAEGDVSGVITDLRIAEKAFGLPQVPVTIVQVGIPSPDVSGVDEWDMDTQYSSGMAQTVKQLYLYTTTSLSDSDLALEISHWVTDNKAKAASASLGECEVFPYIDGSMLVDDMSFLEGASQGQTFFASSGDTGSFCPVGAAGMNGVPAGVPLVQYPASSTYVIGVGGTTLLTNADFSYNDEITWYAGGGGISQFEGPGYWQTNAGVLAAKEANSKGVPDVAMDADPESGALVYVNGVAEGVGGTSLSSPLALGVWARMLTANAKLGYAAPRLYGLYDGTTTPGTYPEGSFHDIIVGSNGAYTALPGYDYTTGLGTFDVAKTYLALR